MSDAGRPTKYDPENHPRIAKAMTSLGATDDDVADALGISSRTLYRWRSEHEAFCQALKIGKDPADERVKMSLYHRACGYSHPEDDIKVVNGEIVITPTIKHYPPDTTACIFWLKNRRPDEWRNNPEGDGGQDMAEVLSKLIDRLPN